MSTFGFDMQVCSALAKEHYHDEEGARAVNNGVDGSVALDIKTAILNETLAADGGTVRLKAAEDVSQVYELQFDDGPAYDIYNYERRGADGIDAWA
jgi:ATP-dependent Clp protease ATP-binding subunit ClpA